MGREEAKIESYLVEQVKKLGGVARKVIYQGAAGSPDRWCLLPGGRLVLIECKAANGRLSPIQKREIKTLKRLGFEVHVAYSKEQIDEALSGKYKEDEVWIDVN